MKVLFLSILFLLNFNYVQADDISKYESVVRNSVIWAYSQIWEDEVYSMSNEDVWGLEFSNNDPSKCLVTITGYANKPSEEGSALYRFWACVNEVKPGDYEVDIIDDVMIAD